MEEDDDKEDKNCCEKICKVRKVGSVERFLQSADFVLACDQEMEECDQCALCDIEVVRRGGEKEEGECDGKKVVR